MKGARVQMISVGEALQIVLGQARLLPTETVPLFKAESRVLSREVLADQDQPPFDRSMMDGYAVRSLDVEYSPVDLRVVEEIPAGSMPSRVLRAGEAARIMTGAPVPEGADAVQMVEKTEPHEDEDLVRIFESVPAGRHIAFQGDDVVAGQIILEKNLILSPPRIGLLAGVGCSRIEVRRRPRAAVAATGDELVETHQNPSPAQIRNSNGPALLARLRGWGVAATDLGIVRDNPSDLDRVILDGLEQDLLILSGGVSMGEYDLVEEALVRNGVELLFRKVAIRPGKPTVFGRKENCLVLGLPGNPVSSLVILQVFAAPLIRKMFGLPEPPPFEATLEESVSKRGNREAYLPGTLHRRRGANHVRPIVSSGSADLLAHSRADVLFIIPAEEEHLDAGNKVRILPLD